MTELPADTRQLELQRTRKSILELSCREGVERYRKIQRGEIIPDFDSRWIFPE